VKIKCDCGDDYFVDEGDSGWQDWMTCPNCDMPWKYLDRNQWISVKDRMPKKAGRYITYEAKNGFIYLSWFTKDREGFYERSGIPIFGVTHWMPLPERPEVERD